MEESGRQRTTDMKTNASKQPKQPKPAVQLKDIKPKKDAKGGGAYVKLNQLDKAVADLRGAVTNGFKDVEHLKNAPEYEPLRSRDDFKSLIGELDVKK